MSEPDPPPSRSETARQRLRDMLADAPASARELSQLAGMRERDVIDHLAHLERSLEGEGSRLLVEPARCKRCGFRFEAKLERARPSRCPACKGERVEAARFGLG